MGNWSGRKFFWFSVICIAGVLLSAVLIAELWPVACGLLPLIPFAVAGFAYEDVAKEKP